MKQLTNLSLVILISVLFTFTASSAFANGNNNQGNNNNDQNFCKQHPQDNKCKKDDNNDCRKHPERRECHVSVPEFGLIPGLVAAGASAGSFYLLKRKKK